MHRILLLVVLCVYINLKCLHSAQLDWQREEEQGLSRNGEEIQKRVAQIVLIAIHTLTIGSAFYRGIDDCKSVTPQLRSNSKMLELLHQQLNEKKRFASMLWGDVMANKRYVERLNSSLYVMVSQLEEIQTLIGNMNIEKRASGFYEVTPVSGASISNGLAAIKEQVTRGLQITKIIKTVVDNVMYVKSCLEKDQKIREGIKKIKKYMKNTDGIIKQIKQLKNVEVKKYNEIYVQYTSSEITTAFTRIQSSLQKSRIASSQTKDLALKTSNYRKQIIVNSLNWETRNQLVKEFISQTLKRISKTFVCFSNIASFKKKIYLSCSQGLKAFENLYDEGKVKVVNNCPKNIPLKRIEIEKTVRSELQVQGKKIKCIRNNVLKLNQVCLYKDLGKTSSFISSQMKMNKQDTPYFLKLCQYKKLTARLKKAVCHQKEKNIGIKKIQNLYKMWNPAELAHVYSKCVLSELQKKIICQFKLGLMSKSAISFHLYPKHFVEDQLKICPSKIMTLSEGQKIEVCMQQWRLRNFDDPEMKTYKSKYSIKALKQTWDMCHEGKLCVDKWKNCRKEDCDFFDDVKYEKVVRKYCYKTCFCSKAVKPKCVDRWSSCIQSNGSCFSLNFHYALSMYNHCHKTCHCLSEEDKKCRDRVSYCDYDKRDCFIPRRKWLMRLRCYKTCGYC